MDSAQNLEIISKLDAEEESNFDDAVEGATNKQKNKSEPDTPADPKDSQTITRLPLVAKKSPVPGTSSSKSSAEDDRSASSTALPPLLENIRKTKVSLSLNNFLSFNQTSSSDIDDTESSASSKSAITPLRVKEFSHEGPRATPQPRPSLTASSPSPMPREVLQISTSLTSDRSVPKTEIVTVTTDYGNQSPDTHSTLVDVVDETGPSSVPKPAANRQSPQHFAQDAHGTENLLPPPSRSFVGNVSSERGTRCRGWRFSKCFRRSASADNESNVHPHTRGAPPTYSSLYTAPIARVNNRRHSLFTDNNSSFVAPVPPPSYAQAQGICFTSYSMDQLLSTSPSSGAFLSPRPTATICPRCAALVVTTIEVRRTAITHVTALVLCLCGCWPCCIIPYCMESCKNTDHYCPICRTYLGTYAPW